MVKNIIFFLFFLFSLCYGKEKVYFIDFWPRIEPVKKFLNEFSKYANSTLSSHYTIISEKNIFKSPYKIIDALQADIVQLAIIPSYALNNQFDGVVDSIYSVEKEINIDEMVIPLREKLMNLGFFLLDVFFAGDYYTFSTLNIKKIADKKKISTCIIFSSGKMRKMFSMKFPNIFQIKFPSDIQKLINSGIVNTAVITPVHFYTINLLDSKISYRSRVSHLCERFFVIANNSYWNRLEFDEKSIIWSYITNHRAEFKVMFSKFYMYVENLISKKITSLSPLKCYTQGCQTQK